MTGTNGPLGQLGAPALHLDSGTCGMKTVKEWMMQSVVPVSDIYAWFLGVAWGSTPTLTSHHGLWCKPPCLSLIVMSVGSSQAGLCGVTWAVPLASEFLLVPVFYSACFSDFLAIDFPGFLSNNSIFTHLSHSQLYCPQ